MKPVSRILVLLVAAVAGLGIGFAWRGNRPAAHDTNEASSEAASNNPSSKNQAHSRPPTPDNSPLATQLAKNLAMSSGVTRWLYWLEAIEKASPSDFPRLAELARKNPAAMRFLAARWAAIAPRQMFDYLAHLSRGDRDFPWDLKDTLLREWMKTDREGVIAALSERPGVPGKQGWQYSVAEQVFATNPERGLKLLQEWSIYSYIPRMKGVAAWAAQDPAHAAQFALDHPASFVSNEVMDTIGKEWSKTDPAAALVFATKNPDALSTRLANQTMTLWASKDLDAAGAWLANADPSVRDRLTPALMEAWAKQDSSGAIAWCEENLAGDTLKQSVAGVLKGAADKDVSTAAQLITGMDPSPERAAGAAEVAKKWFPSWNSSSPPKPEALQWVGSLDNNSINSVLDAVRSQWTSADPQSMADFLTAHGNNYTEPWAYSAVARELVRKNPQAALDWASQQAPDRALQAGSDAFADWSSAQSDAALTWLNNLPANDPRRQPFIKSALRSFAWDRNSIAQFTTLSAADPALATQVVKDMRLSPDRQTELLAAIKKP